MRFDWISRSLAGILVCLFALAPAAVALCGRDCGAVSVERASEHHAEHQHDHASHGVPSSGDRPSHDREAHDCHTDAPAADVGTIGAGPRPCTHSTYESDPAKLASMASDAFALHHALPATGASPDIEPPALAWAGTIRPAIPSQEVTPALVLPLRI
ncbi:MAG: hypothetical protein AB7F99_16190 [Vicinamibacterales bacterium]